MNYCVYYSLSQRVNRNFIDIISIYASNLASNVQVFFDKENGLIKLCQQIIINIDSVKNNGALSSFKRDQSHSALSNIMCWFFREEEYAYIFYFVFLAAFKTCENILCASVFYGNIDFS